MLSIRLSLLLEVVMCDVDDQARKVQSCLDVIRDSIADVASKLLARNCLLQILQPFVFGFVRKIASVEAARTLDLDVVANQSLLDFSDDYLRFDACTLSSKLQAQRLMAMIVRNNLLNLIRDSQTQSKSPERGFISLSELKSDDETRLVSGERTPDEYCIANNLDATSLKLVEAKLETGEPVESKLLSSGGTVARFELTCSKEQASQWKQSTKNLEILVECDGNQYPIKTKCHFQW
jgi:hypothetical protein